MKKWFTKFLLVVFTSGALLTPSQGANAEGNVKVADESDYSIQSLQEGDEEIVFNYENSIENEYEEDSKTIYTVDVEDEFNIHNENFEMTVSESDNEMTVFSQLDNGSTKLSSEFYVNIETGETYVTETVPNSEGGNTTKVYDIAFTDIEGEEFKATLIDRDSDDVYNINTIDAKASAIPVLAIVLQMGARWAIKKYGQRALISAFGKYALSNAIKNVPSLVVKSKHLQSHTGTWAKFSTNSQATAKSWIKEALQKVSVSNFQINNNEKLSFRFDVSMGRKVGTKGETKIRIVIGYDGKIWSAFPVK
ncbi:MULTISPECIES: SAR2788 family putative toxin [unclassified Exiguobacterium]|uniref:SAR2788 family putative toxin n=1 Tax=unclassified Exiguobacterium TaxID=2644629 RepID=UPI0008BFEAB8|nr:MULTISPECIES: SAR2788 family putative toxin [unclassified Exiguobacterium]OGX77783.1 hypothetical protein A6395_15505 [Exiguobacterium sp. SH31]TCI59047.1 hypothetical protein EVJ21_14010 [Exiguobacterium sp. SH0S2]